MEIEATQLQPTSLCERLPRRADSDHDYAWRFFRVRDTKENEKYHLIAVGVVTSVDGSDERVDLRAYCLSTSQYHFHGKKEKICDMSARHKHFAVKMTNGFVSVDDEKYRSLNIGSLCFNEIVKWVRRVAAPTHPVEQIELLAGHVHGYAPENVERRYRFYRRFGFQFHADASAPPIKGLSEPMRVSDLVSYGMAKFQNIQELDAISLVQQLAATSERSSDDAVRLQKALDVTFSERWRRRDTIWRHAQLARLPLLCVAFAVGAVIARPGHFGLWT